MRRRSHTATILLSILLFCGSTTTFAIGNYHGGSGTASDPFQIATAAELIELGRHSEDYDCHFMLIADIDMGINAPDGKIFRQAVIAPDTDHTTYEFQGTPFTGTFDGNGFSIQNLTFQYTIVGYIGLFGMIDPAGTVANVILENCTIQFGYNGVTGALVGENHGFIYNCAASVLITNDSGHNNVGGLAGYNYGEIVDCQTSGAVNGDYYIGGLVGYNDFGLIQQCASTCAVTGDHYYIGGLVGLANHDSLIIYSYATGAVSGNDYVGGLVGCIDNYTTVSNCYATGNISGDIAEAGLVGIMYYSIVEYCYATGEILTPGDGLTGPRDISTTRVSDSFWDLDTSNTATSSGGTGMSTSKMQKQITYLNADWDFETVWTMVEDKTYPFFQWQSQPVAVLCRDGLPYPAGDLNKDCIVNLDDLLTLAASWLVDVR